MFRPFTFNFVAAGLTNPFAASRNTAPPDDARGRNLALPWPSTPVRARPLPRRQRPSPSPSPPRALKSLKRGWDPAFAEPSTTISTATGSVYLGSPAKYRNMCHTSVDDARSGAEEEEEDSGGESAIRARRASGDRGAVT
jgi:hypothetical protein